MATVRNRCENIYRIVVGKGGDADKSAIEFAAPDPRAVLFLTGRYFGGEEVEVFEGDRPLGRLFTTPNGGFWVIKPPAAHGREDATA